MRTLFRSGLAPLFAAAALALPAVAQPDSVTVVAGERYEAGALQRALWGDNYRDLWTTPLRVEVLDPDTFAGGLVPLRAGGDFASSTLHLRGADGRRYVFRSIDKRSGESLGPELTGTLVSWIVQDQVSASHPGAPLMVPPLLRAAGVLHTPPRLAVMADRASLAGCRAQFAGMLGHIEERADEHDPEEGLVEEDEADPRSCGAEIPEPPDGPEFAGAERVKGTENFLDDLEDDPRDRVDARAYLTARLMDVLLGDWDRHEDQWRWARFDSAGYRVWRPVPRDRDHAFVKHEGVLLAIGRPVFLRMVRFGDELPDLRGIAVQAEPLDRRLLSSLPREAWEETAATLAARVTDAAIDSAVAALPPEYRARSGPLIARQLRARRAELPGFAARWYAEIARNVDVHTSDADETATIDRLPDGSVEVAVVAEDLAVFRRRFLPAETDDVRLYLHGGDDRAVVRGAGRGVGVRVIGGGGDDVLVDSSSAASGVAFYDDRGDNRLVAGRGTRIDTRDWEAPVDSSTLAGERTVRDHGWSASTFSPWVDWSRAGPVVGGGPKIVKYGFRRLPHHFVAGVRAGWAPLETRFVVEAYGDLHPENARHWYSAQAYASNLDNVRFFGFGNRSPAEGSTVEDVWLRRVRAAPSLHLPLGGGVLLEAGPVAQWTEAEVRAGSPLALEAPRGTAAVTQLGAAAELVADGRDAPGFPRRGWRLALGGDAFPVVSGDAGAFGETRAEASAYLPLGAGPVLALRAGGARAWGEYPFFAAAMLGGESTLRGHTGFRFAGDAMAFGGAELRQPLFRANLGVRGTVGVLALADAGRVWDDGDSPGGWHTAVGGGAFFHALGQSVYVTVARGERTSLNFGVGMPF